MTDAEECPPQFLLECLVCGSTDPCEHDETEGKVDGERAQVTSRLRVTYSNFAAAIRGCQTAGMTAKQIGEEMGLNATVVRELINAWGLDT